MATTDEVLKEYQKRIRDLDAELKRKNNFLDYAMDEKQEERLYNILHDLLLLLGSNVGGLACKVAGEYLELADNAYYSE